MTVSIIAAVATNGVIGLEGRMPWHLGADLKRFKALTMGHHLVMGRKTFESIGRPLPGRTTIVISRSGFAADGTTTASSLEEAVQMAAGDAEVFIAGGAEIYALAIHLADRMYVTRVHAEPEGDAFFPEFDDVAEWHLVDSEHCEPDEKNDYAYSFLTYERIGSGEELVGEDVD